MSKWYGNLDNRLMEGKTLEPIKEGTDITMYYWSDRTCYYVTRVINEKHIFVKEYEVKHKGEPYAQNWEYIKDPNKPEHEWVYRYKGWWRVYANGSYGKIDNKISFGIRDYYYDYEF